MKESSAHEQIKNSLEKAIDYSFKDRALLQTALTHRSISLDDKSSHHGSNNERLEFLGDSVLSLVCSEFLYKSFANLSEGDLSRLRAQYVCQDNLSKGASTLNLKDALCADKAMKRSGATGSPAVLSDALEAIFGAVYLDGGFDAAKKVIFKVLGIPSKTVDEQDRDAKSLLQELVQSDHKEAPSYKLLNASGPDHAPVFHVGVFIKDSLIASASGESKKIAAQNAARRALKILNNEES